MSLFYNLNSKYKNASVIHINCTIKPNFKDQYQDIVVFRDENFNVNSINIFNQSLIKNMPENFGYLDSSLEKRWLNKIKKLNNKYNFIIPQYFRVGKVIKRENHPNTDKLYILTVDFGDSQKTIITNTTYTLENRMFIFALAGAITATGTEIMVNKVMGISSEGMVCSYTSLDLNNEKNKELFEGKLFYNLNDKDKAKYLGAELPIILRDFKNKIY